MFSKINQRLLVLFMAFSVWLFDAGIYAQSNSASQIKVSGKITDEAGNGISGVSVIVKGSSAGTTTDASGAYSITVPDSRAVLVFSYTGYSSREVTVGRQTSVNIQLSPDTKNLEDVVVVGYGTQRKVDLTGAVSSITKRDFVSKPFTIRNNICYIVKDLILRINLET